MSTFYCYSKFRHGHSLFLWRHPVKLVSSTLLLYHMYFQLKWIHICCWEQFSMNGSNWWHIFSTTEIFSPLTPHFLFLSLSLTQISLPRTFYAHVCWCGYIHVCTYIWIHTYIQVFILPHSFLPHFLHGNVIKWKYFPRYWPFVRGIHRSPVNSAHKGQWRGTLMFLLICAWINGWVNNREAGDLRRYRARNVTVTLSELTPRANMP